MTIFPALLLAACAAWSQPGRTAGAVVQSDEWRVIRAPERQEEFTGNVRYRSGATVMRCDWAMFKHEPQIWQLRGHVDVKHKLEAGDALEAVGDTGLLEQRTRSGWLRAKDRVSFKRVPLDGAPDYGESREARWQGRDVVFLEGAVRLWGPRLDAWSDRARYTDASTELELAGGRPVVRKFPGWDAKDDFSGVVKGDVVRAWRAQNRLSADGDVRGWIEFSEKKR